MNYNFKIGLISIILVFNLAYLPAFSITEQEHHHCSCEELHHHSNVVVKQGSMLSINDCISIGIQNSPVIKEYEHKFELAKSNLGGAKSAYFPSLSAGTGISQIKNSNHEDFISDYKEYPAFGIMLNKMIWDFGKTTANIRMEESFKLAAQYEFEDSVCSTVFAIKTRYYELLKAQSLYNAAKRNQKIHEELVELISNKKNKNEADLLNAKVELFEAKKSTLNAELVYKNAKENLTNSMYLIDSPNYSIYETQTYNYLAEDSKFHNVSNTKYAKVHKDETIFEHPKFTKKEAVELAYKNSPDLKVLVSVYNAMEQSLLYVKRSFYPEINGNVGYDLLNTNQYYNNDLSIGLSVSSNLNAMKQKYDIKGANAQLDIAQDEIDKFKKDLYFRVHKALNKVDETQLLIPVAKEEEIFANKNLDITKKSYLSGSMNQLELQNSANSYYNSLKNIINSQYKYNIALIDLEMSMHYHLLDYHEKSEHSIEYHDEDASNVLSKLINCKKKHKTDE